MVVHVCVCACMCTTAFVWRSEGTLEGWPFFSTLGILGIELRSSGLAPDAFIHWVILIAPKHSFSVVLFRNNWQTIPLTKSTQLRRFSVFTKPCSYCRILLEQFQHSVPVSALIPFSGSHLRTCVVVVDLLFQTFRTVQRCRKWLTHCLQCVETQASLCEAIDRTVLQATDAMLTQATQGAL